MPENQAAIRLVCLELALKVRASKEDLATRVERFAEYATEPAKLGALKLAVQTHGISTRVGVDGEGGLLAVAQGYYEIIKPKIERPEPAIVTPRRGRKQIKH